MKLSECKILLVDDETELLELVKEHLSCAGFNNTDTAQNAKQADEMYRKNNYNLVLLDVMLPDGDGFSLFDGWQKSQIRTPVIFVSARDEDTARLKGLGLGADDYITKPFLPEELCLRVKAVLRRTETLTDDENITIGNVSVNFSSGIITKDGKESELTAKEFMLLKKLNENRGRIVTINQLMDTLWPDGAYGLENSLMVHIRRLRAKLEENPSKPVYLQTVRGLGYRLNK